MSRNARRQMRFGDQKVQKLRKKFYFDGEECVCVCFGMKMAIRMPDLRSAFHYAVTSTGRVEVLSFPSRPIWYGSNDSTHTYRIVTIEVLVCRNLSKYKLHIYNATRITLYYCYRYLCCLLYIYGVYRRFLRMHTLHFPEANALAATHLNVDSFLEQKRALRVVQH